MIIKYRFKYFILCIIVKSKIILEIIVVKVLLIIYMNKNIQKYYLIILDISVNYKKQVVITGIKLNI